MAWTDQNEKGQAGWFAERIPQLRIAMAGLQISEPSYTDSILHPAFADKSVVYEKLDTFTEFLQVQAIPIASTLEALSAAYLIVDMRFDISGDGRSTEGLPLPSSVARSQRPHGSYRILAISVDVLEASKIHQTRKSNGKPGQPGPNKPKAKNGKPPPSKTNPQLVNLYDSVTAEWKPKRPSIEIIHALQANRDVVELAKQQELDIDSDLIRNAKKYRRENPR